MDGSVMEVRKFVSRGGIRVYGMPVETFPGHVNNIYLIVDGDTLTLVDVGSGTDESVEELHQRFDEVMDESVMTAAKLVTQVDPLPAGLGDPYEVKINFELNQ